MALRLCLPRDNRRDASSLRWQFGSIQFIKPPLTSKGMQGWPQRGALSMASTCLPPTSAPPRGVVWAHPRGGHPHRGHCTPRPPLPRAPHAVATPAAVTPAAVAPCTTTSRPSRPPPRHRTPGRPVSPHWGGHPGSAPPKPILFSGSLNGNGGWQWLQLSGSWAAQRVRGTQSKVAFTITKKLKNQHFQTERDTLCI